MLYSDVFHVFKRESDNAGCSAALTAMSTESQSVTYRVRLETEGHRKGGRGKIAGRRGGGETDRQTERKGGRKGEREKEGGRDEERLTGLGLVGAVSTPGTVSRSGGVSITTRCSSSACSSSSSSCNTGRR